MSWNAGADVTTGDLITASQWNNYLGADGSVDYLKGRLNWKATPAAVLSDTDRTTDQDWTDIDLTSDASANAEWAVLQLRLHIDSVSSGQVSLLVRENGSSETANVPRLFFTTADGRTAGGDYYATVIVGLDGDNIFEYKIDVSGTIQVDSYIHVLGYVE